MILGISSLSGSLPKPRFTVMAADDHAIVLSGIRLLLQAAEDFRLIAEIRSSEATLAAILECVPDVLILDLWMGDHDGIELIRKIHDGWPEIRILVYSMNDERNYAVRALRAGASGYLMKSHGLDELLTALRIVAQGGRYLGPELGAELIDHGLRPSPEARNPAMLSFLSDRELQILRLIGLGHTTASIASALYISTKTVGAHRENLKNKLSAENSAVLVRKATLLVESRVL